MRGCPQEQHQGQQSWERAKRGINCGRTCKHRKTPCQSAKHNIQPSAPFQPSCINNCVGKGTEENVQRRHCVKRKGSRGYRNRKHRPDDHQPLAAMLKIAVQKWTVFCASHFCINIALKVLVECPRSRRRHHDCQRQNKNLPTRQRLARSNCHTTQGCQGDYHADAQFE